LRLLGGFCRDAVKRNRARDDSVKKAVARPILW